MRFVATLKPKRTTASQLFKRLNSYSKQNPLYKALKAFWKIIKTLFMLTYIDCLDLRQAIEKQLNKGESSNKFSKAVSFGNNHEFLQGEKSEQEIADSCRRLIKNSIVCWNYLYLSHVLMMVCQSARLKKPPPPRMAQGFFYCLHCLVTLALSGGYHQRPYKKLGNYDYRRIVMFVIGSIFSRLGRVRIVILRMSK